MQPFVKQSISTISKALPQPRSNSAANNTADNTTDRSTNRTTDTGTYSGTGFAAYRSASPTTSRGTNTLGGRPDYFLAFTYGRIVRVFLPLPVRINRKSRHRTCPATPLESSTSGASRCANCFCTGGPFRCIGYFPVLELPSTDGIMESIFYLAGPSSTIRRPFEGCACCPQAACFHYRLDITSTTDSPFGCIYWIPPVAIIDRRNEIATYRTLDRLGNRASVCDFFASICECLPCLGLPISNIAGIGFQGVVQGDFFLFNTTFVDLI